MERGDNQEGEEIQSGAEESRHPHRAQHEGGGRGGDTEGAGGGEETFWLQQALWSRAGGPGGGGDSLDPLGETSLRK